MVRRKEVGLEAIVDNTKYMFMSHEQNSAHNHDEKILFKILTKIKYLE